MILTLDLGTTTGWAFYSPSTKIISDIKLLKTNRFSNLGMKVLEFNKFLTDLFTNQSIQEVYFEEVIGHRNSIDGQYYGAYLGCLTAFCEHNNIPYQGVAVGTIKKHITGKGNANKEAMLKAVITKGHKPQTHDEADALALMYYILESVKGIKI